MKLRKILLLFLIVSFGLIIEGVNVARDVLNDESFEGLRDLNFDGDFPFSRISRFRGPSHDFVDSQTAEATGVSAIEVTNAYGDVVVRRASGSKAEIGIGLRKEVFARDSRTAESVADKLKLVISREGGLLKVGTTRDARANYRVKTYIDIDTPSPLDIRIVNRHGRIVVEGAKAVNVSGEFDEMRVVDVSGDCAAKNRHGNLEVISAALGCRVEVDFGDVHMERLMGASNIEVSHGSVTALDLAALTATLKFSDLQARKIGGDLETEGEHSDLRIDDVKGTVTLNNQGDVDIQNIVGRVSIENQRGHVRLRKAAASVTIRNTFDAVTASDVEGLLEITNRHGSIHANRFSKGANLETDSEDIDVSDFAGPLNAILKRGDISVKPDRKVGWPIDIQVDIGDVTLGLPDSINALLDASVERGEVEGKVGALRSMEQGKRLLKATIGVGGPLVKLRSRLGNIRVSSEDDIEVDEPDSPDAPEIEARFSLPLGADPLPVPPIPPRVREGHEPPRVPRPPHVSVVPEPPAKPSPGHR